MRNKKVLIISIITIFLISLILLLSIPFTNVVSISSRKNPSERYYSQQAYCNGFIISYTHSVNKGRVHDYYDCLKKSDELCLDSTIFVSYGAGIPEPEETPGAQFTVLENGYVINNLNRKVPYLMMAVGVIAEHSFAINKPSCNYGEVTDEIFLKDLFAPKTSLILKTTRVSLLEYIFHKI